MRTLHLFNELFESQAFGHIAKPDLLPVGERRCDSDNVDRFGILFQGKINKNTACRSCGRILLADIDLFIIKGEKQ